MRSKGPAKVSDGAGYDFVELGRLVWDLKAAGIESPEIWYPALSAACGRLGIDPSAAASDVAELWDATIKPGEDLLTSAVRWAAEDPLPPDGLPIIYRLDRVYRVLASMAFWLESYHAGRREFFAFGCQAIASRIDADRKTVGRWIRQLHADKVIRLRTNPDGTFYYDRHAGDSYECRYTGPRPGASVDRPVVSNGGVK